MDTFLGLLFCIMGSSFLLKGSRENKRRAFIQLLVSRIKKFEHLVWKWRNKAIIKCVKNLYYSNSLYLFRCNLYIHYFSGWFFFLKRIFQIQWKKKNKFSDYLLSSSISFLFVCVCLSIFLIIFFKGRMYWNF